MIKCSLCLSFRLLQKEVKFIIRIHRKLLWDELTREANPEPRLLTPVARDLPWAVSFHVSCGTVTSQVAAATALPVHHASPL